MKNLFKSYPTQSHLIPLNPTIISSLLYIYIIRYQLALVQNEGLLSAQVLDDILSINNMVKPKMSA